MKHIVINKDTPESELHPGVLAVTELTYGRVPVWTNKDGLLEQEDSHDA